MASTVGHALAGVVLYQCFSNDDGGRGLPRPLALAASAALANLPDIDFFLGYLIHGDPRAMHAGVTHTVPFALLAALGAAGARLFGGVGRTFGIAFLIVLSHVLLDFASGTSLGFAPGHGVMLLYPISEERWDAPIKLFLGAHHRDLESLLSLHNLTAVLWESAFFVPLIYLLAQRWRRRGRPWRVDRPTASKNP